MLPDLLRFDPVLVERPWGGRRLERFGRTLPDGAPIGESWEITDLPENDRCSRVSAGPLAGASLLDLVTRYGSRFLGSAQPTAAGRFPLLVKLLDAREHLSVQVHPHEEYAASHPGTSAKTESWYVVAAEEGAGMFLDVRDDVTDGELMAAVGTAAIVPLLVAAPGRLGGFHHIPAGMVHALGGGVMVLEVQVPSDTTFRLYDWPDEYHRPSRPLELEGAKATIVRSDPTAVSLEPMGAPGSRDLITTHAYWMREHRGGVVQLDRRPELRIVSVVQGKAHLGGVTVEAGASVVLPADSGVIGPFELSDRAVVIETGLA